MLEHRNFVKKLVFAVETLPVNLVAAGLVSELFAVVLFCGFLLAVRGGVPPSVVWLPAVVDPASVVHGGRELVSGGAGSLCARPGPGDGVRADHLVFRNADLLS